MSEVFQTIGQILYVIFSAIWQGVSALGMKVYEWFKTISLPVAPTMMKIFSNVKINRYILLAVCIYIAAINIITFIMFGSDKSRAKKKRQRIRESTLMKLCFFGGATGGIIGIHVFAHKTKHKKFSVGVPILFVIQLIFLSFIIGFLGFWAS